MIKASALASKAGLAAPKALMLSAVKGQSLAELLLSLFPDFSAMFESFAGMLIWRTVRAFSDSEHIDMLKPILLPVTINPVRMISFISKAIANSKASPNFAALRTA